ncbi:unnamed protein product [Parnassius apollo]|uniref:(apollo) hypothetical protein n=1 Tax=Parnassius apollo TaxID=110799 RepID=A0A8S3XG75_PARAO|nr:unnamed protein product [Parnassius apollo]
MQPLIFLTVASLLAVVLGEVAVFKKCESASDDICTVSEVRITPCKGNKICKLNKGEEYSISFDFEPKFSTPKLKTGVFWANGAVDVPFAALQDADGCQYTTCPTEAGKSQQLNYSLRIGKKFPSGKFTFKWKVWNEENDDQYCCFLTNIRM